MAERSDYLSDVSAVKERSILRNVYLWMTAGLALTGIVALWMVSSGNVVSIERSGIYWVFAIGEVALVFFLTLRIMSMSPQVAAISFIAYSLLNGVTMSILFVVYTRTSVASTFFITSATFAGMSLYAIVTKRNLSGIGHYLMMAVWGLIIASVINFFLKSSGLYYIISYVGVLVFCGLTAYDTQYITNLSREYSGSVSEDDYMRLSIIGALKLYLDFINLFIYFLRIFGRRK